MKAAPGGRRLSFKECPNLPLRSQPERNQYSETVAIEQDNRPTKRSKNVPRRTRQTALKDTKTIEKMRAFCPPADCVDADSLVAHSSYPSSYPTEPPYLITHTPPKPDNDNVIPSWDHVGDTVKGLAATVALQIREKPVWAFSFNLTPEAEAKALRVPGRFLDSLKRSFSKHLDRAGIRLDYWFAIDIEKGRLHIHGAFGADREQHQRLKDIMRKAWGKQKHHPQFQIDIRPCDQNREGKKWIWATYAMRNRRRVKARIGDRTFTITRPLQRNAEWTYGEIRRIMVLPCPT
jgi:hypothetical protein